MAGFVGVVAGACLVVGVAVWRGITTANQREAASRRWGESHANGVHVRVTCGELTAETMRRAAREFSKRMEHQIKQAEEGMRRPTFCHGTQEAFEAMQHQGPEVTLASLGEFQEEGGRA